jgi:hypothetical protein
LNLFLIFDFDFQFHMGVCHCQPRLEMKPPIIGMVPD